MGGFVVYNLRNHEIISVVLCVLQLLSSFMYSERAITTWSFLFELNSGLPAEPINTVCTLRTSHRKGPEGRTSSLDVTGFAVRIVPDSLCFLFL